MAGACGTTIDLFIDGDAMEASTPDEPDASAGGTDGAGSTGAAGGGGELSEPGAIPQPGEPVLLEINPGAPCADDISLTDDLLEVVYDNDDYSMMTSRRSNLLGPWSPAALVPGVAQAGFDTGGEISRDGLSLWWSSWRPDRTNEFDLFFSTRPSRDAPWGPATSVDELNTLELEAFPTLTDDRLDLVFISLGPGLDRDLFSSTRASKDDPWGPRVPLTSLNTEWGEHGPHLSADGLTLYFGSDRPGGAGGRDLYEAHRDTRSAEFSPPQPMTELNSDQNDEDPWVSSDGSVFVFARLTPGGDCVFLSVQR